MDLDADTIRITLHLLGITVWVGGQLTLAGLLPALRQLGGDAPKAVARQFNRIAWPAFAVVILTGLWNLGSVDIGDRDTDYQVALFVKLCIVALSGIAAFLHTRASTRVGLAVWGALTALSALAAVLFGAMLVS